MGKHSEFIKAIKRDDIRFIKEELNAQKRSPFKGNKMLKQTFNIAKLGHSIINIYPIIANAVI